MKPKSIFYQKTRLTNLKPTHLYPRGASNTLTTTACTFSSLADSTLKEISSR